MAIINPSNVNEIEFDQQDIEVFKIPDVKERIATLQNIFFPRLKLLVKDSLEVITQIYGVEPYEKMTDVKKPSNRPDAATNTGYGHVYVGISGKRRNTNKDQPLAIKNASGKPKYIHSAYLTFDVSLAGSVRVVFEPFTTSVESNFISKVRQEMLSNFELINTLFKDLKIHYNNSKTVGNSDDFRKLIIEKDFVLDIHSLYFCTDAFFVPTNFKDELWKLQRAFVGLYSLLDLFISIGDGREPRLTEMLNEFNHWSQKDNVVVDFESNKSVVRVIGRSNDFDLPEFEFWQPKSKVAEPVVRDPNVRISTGYKEEIINDQAKREIAEAWKELINLPVDSFFNPENLTDARERTNRAIVQRQGQSKFRSELLKAYGGQCAITDCDAEAALEAAHIFPYRGNDTNHVKNGLLLRADIHTLFDLNLISIDPNTSKVVVSSSLLNTCYKELNGKSLKSPRDYASPSPDAIARHYQIFLLKQNNS
jgi:hypothetical protein